MRLRTLATTIVALLACGALLRWASTRVADGDAEVRRRDVSQQGTRDTIELDGGAEERASRTPAAADMTTRRTEAMPEALDAPDVTDFVRVVSAEQIPLEHVQWSVDAEHWTEVSADLVPQDARLVRAAGHPGSEVPESSDVVELRADSVLRLTCPGLGDAALDAVLDTQFGLPSPERVAAFFLGPGGRDELVLAIDIERWSHEWAIGEVHARVVLPAGAALFVDWTAQRDERRVLALDLDPAWLFAPAGDLVITEKGAPVAPGVPRSVGLRLLGTNDGRSLHRDDRLHISMQQRWRGWSGVTISAGRVQLKNVPLGEEVLVRWRRADGWYGRLRHSHDGRPTSIALHAPARVRGRVVDELGAGMAGVSPSILFPRDGERPRLSIAWNVGNVVSTDTTGAFELTLPQSIPAAAPSPDFPETLPTSGVLRLREQGYDEVLVDVLLGPGGVVDLGEIVLSARAAHLILRHGDELPAELYDVGWVDGNQARWMAVEAIRETGPGASEILLSTHEFDRQGLPPAIMIMGEGAFIGALLRDGVYETVPSARFDAVIDVTQLSPPPAFLRVSIIWHGIEAQIHGAFGDEIRTSHARVDELVPGEGTSVFWIERAEDGEVTSRGIGALGAIPSTIRLRR